MKVKEALNAGGRIRPVDIKARAALLSFAKEMRKGAAIAELSGAGSPFFSRIARELRGEANLQQAEVLAASAQEMEQAVRQQRRIERQWTATAIDLAEKW